MNETKARYPESLYRNATDPDPAPGPEPNPDDDAGDGDDCLKMECGEQDQEGDGVEADRRFRRGAVFHEAAFHYLDACRGFLISFEELAKAWERLRPEQRLGVAHPGQVMEQITREVGCSGRPLGGMDARALLGMADGRGFTIPDGRRAENVTFRRG